MSQVRVQVPFSIGAFNDALWFTLEEYLALAPEQLEALQQERYQNWINAVENPPPVDPDHDASLQEDLQQQLQAELQAIDDQVAALEARKDVVETLLSNAE